MKVRHSKTTMIPVTDPPPLHRRRGALPSFRSLGILLILSAAPTTPFVFLPKKSNTLPRQSRQRRSDVVSMRLNPAVFKVGLGTTCTVSLDTRM